MTLGNSRSRCKILFEVLTICAVFTFLVLMEFGVLPEIQSIGFYCGDPKISHKFGGDTVSVKALLSSTVLLPFAVMCGVEFGCYGRHEFAKRGDSKRVWMSQSFAWYREYLSGLLIVFFLTCVGKVLVGEPRPHFLDTCKPFQAFNCTSGYVSSYTCTNSEMSKLRVRDSSKSFPSGHASLSVYFFTFTAWYLQQRMASLSALIVAWLQTLLLTWALFCSVTRITDHRHHWWDVLAGSILGAAIGIYTVYQFCCNFQVGTYRALSVSTETEKDPEKPKENYFKGSVTERKIAAPSPEVTGQSLSKVTTT